MNGGGSHGHNHQGSSHNALDARYAPAAVQPIYQPSAPPLPYHLTSAFNEAASIAPPKALPQLPSAGRALHRSLTLPEMGPNGASAPPAPVSELHRTQSITPSSWRKERKQRYNAIIQAMKQGKYQYDPQAEHFAAIREGLRHDI